MPSRVYGVLSLRVGGQPLEIGTEWTYDIGGITRETVLGAGGPIGHKIMPIAAYIEGTVYDAPDVPLSSFKAIQGQDVTLHLYNGKTVYLRSAAQVGELTVEGHEGAIKLRLEGISGGEA